MDNKQVIQKFQEKIDWAKQNRYPYVSESDVELYKMAIDALAVPSAEPREVLYSGDGYADGEMVYDMAECPNCGREFEYGDETWNCNFCPDCGQALKWEGEEE